MTDKRKQTTTLLSSDHRFDPRLGSVSPVDDVMKNNVRSIEMKVLNTQGDDQDDKQSHPDNDTLETSLDNNVDDNQKLKNARSKSKNSYQNNDLKPVPIDLVDEPVSTPTSLKSSQVLSPRHRVSVRSDQSSELDITLPDSRNSGDSRFLASGSSGSEFYCVDHMCLVFEDVSRNINILLLRFFCLLSA